MAKGIKW